MSARRRMAWRRLRDHWDDPEYGAVETIACPSCGVAKGVQCWRRGGKGAHTPRMLLAAQICEGNTLR